jgi:hypothetical protein
MNSNVGTDISVRIVRLTTQDPKAVQQRCQKPQIYENAFHELKLTKHADVKRAWVSFLPTRSGILKTYR